MNRSSNIEQLNSFIQLHKIVVLGVDNYLNYPNYNINLVNISLNQEQFKIYVFDEYNDLEYNNIN